MKKLKIPIICPNCKHRIEMEVSKLVPGSSARCPYCGTVFDFKGDDGRKVQKALDDLEKAIKHLNKNLTFKLKL